MSYNIDTVKLIDCPSRLTMTNAAIHKWSGDDLDLLPETASDWIEDLARGDQQRVDITDQFTWCGLGSGRAYSETLADFLRWTCGHASYLLTWEGGDAHTVLRVCDGIAFEHEAAFAVGDLKGKL